MLDILRVLFTPVQWFVDCGNVFLSLLSMVPPPLWILIYFAISIFVIRLLVGLL